jgi:hypothetical protein
MKMDKEPFMPYEIINVKISEANHPFDKKHELKRGDG